MASPFKARLIAHYLPQFHPIPENDSWWGPGFTEWTNVAKARDLFPGHIQPRIPLDMGYYDLRLPESRAEQADLARSYGIEGFCYWHYWFGGGKRILERPFNDVLLSRKPDFPFCLAWANHTWSGIWHGAPDTILIEQCYPGVNDYKAHFYCMLDAFLDKRYLKVDGKNIFCIYRPSDFDDAALFMSTWRDLAKLEGAPDFFFVAITDYPWDFPPARYDAHTTNPPVGQLPYQGIKPINSEISRLVKSSDLPYNADNLPQIYRYETYVANAFPPPTRRREFLPCVLPNWDNTPRSGRNGFVLIESTPELYSCHLHEAVNMVSTYPSDHNIIFVKSWNEWAEGNFLEPDLIWEHSYLKATLNTIVT